MIVEVTLASHTNVGKTTLARTLLRRDIGEIRDQAHVTEAPEAHVLIESPAGDALRLWDTPGFGDSARLLRRLRQSDNPIGWFLSQVWDRLADRPFFHTQQAVRNVRDVSDVVLYLVSAGEDPQSAAYVEVEMQILGWIGKPVILLLNQIGPPRGPRADAADARAWREHVAAHACVRATLALDAFARCWVQEDALLSAIESVLDAERASAAGRLREAWSARNLGVFAESARALAAHLARCATDAESEPRGEGAAGGWLAAIASAGRGELQRDDPAMASLARRFDADVRATTDALISLHGLGGHAAEEVLARVGSHFDVSRPADAAKAGVLGGLVSGALGGLAADLAAGGLTFGAGVLVGGMLGALGAGGAAKAYNRLRGDESTRVRWSAEFLTGRFAAALLTYLAVAHFGRGRGDFVASEYPAHWRDLVEGRVAASRDALERIWSSAPAAAVDAVQHELARLVEDAMRELLSILYPEAKAIFAGSADPRAHQAAIVAGSGSEHPEEHPHG